MAGPHTPKVIPEPARAAQPARDEDQPEETAVHGCDCMMTKITKIF